MHNLGSTSDHSFKDFYLPICLNTQKWLNGFNGVSFYCIIIYIGIFIRPIRSKDIYFIDVTMKASRLILSFLGF